MSRFQLTVYSCSGSVAPNEDKQNNVKERKKKGMVSTNSRKKRGIIEGRKR